MALGAGMLGVALLTGGATASIGNTGTHDDFDHTVESSYNGSNTWTYTVYGY